MKVQIFSHDIIFLTCLFNHLKKNLKIKFAGTLSQPLKQMAMLLMVRLPVIFNAEDGTFVLKIGPCSAQFLLCDPAKIFLTSKFSYSNLTQNTKTGTANRCGGRPGRLLIANHLDQSLWLPNLEQGAAVRSYLLHSSLAGVRLDCVFSQPPQTVRKCWAKPILQS
jgi:hypothetical protein